MHSCAEEAELFTGTSCCVCVCVCFLYQYPEDPQVDPVVLVQPLAVDVQPVAGEE